MKLTHLILVIASLSLVACTGSDTKRTVQETFERGVSEVNSGNLDDGYQTLLSLHEQGYRSGYLYYNLAVTAYKMDSISVAKYYYVISRQYRETYVVSEQALSYVDSRFPNKAPSLPSLPWERFFDYLERTIGVSLLFILGIFGINLFVLLYLISKKGNTSSWILYFYKILGLFSLVTLIITFYIDYRNARFTEAVMITGQHALKEVPDSNARVLAQTYEGFQFTVDRNASKPDQGWWYVRMSNGVYGWLPVGSIRVIN